MKFYLRHITIPKQLPEVDTPEYIEGLSKYESEIVSINSYVEFDSIEDANRHYAQIYDCELFLEWYPERPKYLTKWT